MQAYTKIYNVLRDRILNGIYPAGDKLPPERVLCESLGVSRITVRHAIRLLEEQGLIERFQGRGTFVRSAQPQKLPIINGDFVGSMRKEAPHLQRQLLNFGQVVPPPAIAEAFGLVKTETCLLLERADILDGQAIAYDRGYLPLRFNRSLDQDLLTRVDFWLILQEREGFTVTHAIETVEAVAANALAVERLGVLPLSPILLVIDTSYGSSGQALGVFESVYRGDRIKLTATHAGGVLPHQRKE